MAIIRASVLYSLFTTHTALYRFHSTRTVLYSYYTSSASWRVRTALGMKGVEYEYRPIDLRGCTQAGDQRTEKYTKLNPVQQVPTLLIDGVTLTQSLPIIEYLDETRGGAPILPKDPIKRAQSRRIAEIVNSWIQPLQSPGLYEVFHECGMDETKCAFFTKHWITKGMTALETTVAETAGKFCVGDDISLADLCLVPQTFNAVYKFGKIDISTLPTVKRVYENCMQEEVFIEAGPAHQPDSPFEK